MFSSKVYSSPSPSTAPATTSQDSGRVRAAPKAPAPPPSIEQKDERDDDDFSLLGIRSSEIPSSPSYSITAKRALFASSLSSGSSGLTLVPMKSSDRGSQSYRLRIVTAGAVTPTAGVAASSFLADPSNIPLSQWSNFAALFDEVRVRSFFVQITPYSNGTTSSGTNSRITSIAMGSFLSKTSIPSNIISVLASDESDTVSPLMVKPHRCHLRVPVLGFAPTSAPGGDTYRGCPGSVQLYATGDGTNSILTYFVCGIYQLRGRVL